MISLPVRGGTSARSDDRVGGTRRNTLSPRAGRPTPPTRLAFGSPPSPEGEGKNRGQFDMEMVWVGWAAGWGAAAGAAAGAGFGAAGASRRP